MKQMLTLLAATALIAQPALAKGSIEGTWKWELGKQSCMSGAPAKSWDSSKDFNMTFEGTFTFTQKELISSFNVSYKFTKEQAETSKQQFADARKVWEGLPDSEDKTKALEEIDKGEKIIDQYLAGISCKVSETRPYGLQKNILTTGKLTSHTSDCPNDSATDDDKDHPVQVSISKDGKILKSIDLEVETKDDQTCPKGDKTVLIFTRVN